MEKVIGNELGNKEGWPILSKMTTLFFHLIHYLLCFLAGAGKDDKNELGNRKGWSILTKLSTFFYYLIHPPLSLLTPAKKHKK